MLLGGVAATFLASFLLVPMIGQEFFPQVDAGQITMTVRCPSNLRLDATEERIAKLEGLIEEQIPQAERQMIVSEMGLNPDWSSAYTTNAGQQDAIVRIQLTEERTLTRTAIRDQVAARNRSGRPVRRHECGVRHRRHGLGSAQLRGLVADRH